MCGIAGGVHPDRQWRPERDQQISAFVHALRPRGPDGQGVQSGPGWCLGHTRLSIQDLSVRGHQPLRDPELGLSIVYNGEIYNFRELRQELESKGYRFFSDTDTEVLLKGFHCWGKDVLAKLNGMFALALYNERDHELFLARDRFGIKPLYYTQPEGQGLFWSSAPWPLLGTLPAPPTLSKRALHYYFSFHSVVPAPWTLIDGVHKLAPGHYGTWSATKGLSIAPYWKMEYGPESDQKKWKLEDWIHGLEDQLFAAIRRRLVADVPVGLFLSGGLDSSLIAAIMTKEMDQKLNTYSVGFSGAGGERGNEFPFSKMVAEKFETEHHEFSVTPKELLDHLPDAITNQLEPMMSHDNIGFYLLSKKARQSTKVVQCGQGADEVFAGYHWYPEMLQAQDPVAAYTNAFFDRDHEEMKNLLAPGLVDRDYASEFVEDHFAASGAQDSLDKALRIDTTVMLVEDPVKRIDSNTMAWGLEARVPFLDHELVEFAARIPAEYKLSNGGKGILKEIGYKYLPREVIDRPKGYFPVPELKYIDGPFLDLARDVLGSPLAKSRHLFNEETVQTYLSQPREHLSPLRGSKLWQVTVLEWWLQLHQIGV